MAEEFCDEEKDEQDKLYIQSRFDLGYILTSIHI